MRIHQVALALVLTSMVSTSRLSRRVSAAERSTEERATPHLEVKAWELSNGLRVLFGEDHKAPIATVQVFYHVGSKDEKVGIRGMAHMFEHLMFKGTDRVPPEEHARMLKTVGGIANAFTTEDITAYHQTVPPSYVGFALELEADRMRHLYLMPSTVASERRVVLEEKRLRVDNDPVGQALELFRATAFTTHPYRWTAIGSEEDLKRVTVADCQRFYDTYYQPNNATVIVVGDVKETEVRAWVTQYFAAVPSGPVPPRGQLIEPPQTQPREKLLQRPVELPVLVGGYPIPAARHPDIPALIVLGTIFSEGESSRMYQRLVRRDRLALGAGGLAQVMEDPGQFLVFAAHAPDRDQAKVRTAVLEEVQKVRNDGVTAGELERAKNQLAAQAIYGLESVDGMATRLGEAQYVQGDWHRFLEGADRYLGVTADDVKRVAQKYLAEDKLTLVILRPTPPVKGGAK